MKCFLICIAFLFSFNSDIFSQITIDTSFEGANARILSIDNSSNTIKIESKLRSGDVHNVVFYFKVNGFSLSSPLKILIKYSQQYYLPNLAAYSYDGITWNRFEGFINGDVKEYSRIYSQNSVYFCYGYPYVYSDLLELVSRLNGNQFVTISNLIKSGEGRDVKLFRISEPCVADTEKYMIWVIGRQHAMETHSNYVVEGLMDYLISNEPSADKLRRKAIIYIVPVMDVDNAAKGGTGKDRLPVDFNRDWDSPSYWPAINAVKKKISQTTIQNPLKIFFDSHDPFPNGDDLFFYSLYETGPKSVNLDFYRKLVQENAGYVFNRQPLYLTNGQTASRYIDSVYQSTDLTLSLETGWSYRTDNIPWTIPLYKSNGLYLGTGMSEYIGNIIRPGDIILDNTDTASGVTITGSWTSSTFTPGYWGKNYIHDGNTGKGQKSVRYTPVIPSEGYYEVFIRWTQEPDRAENVPVKIFYNGGVKDTNLNQRTKGAEWVSSGIFNFLSGNNGSVLIENAGTINHVIADAVRFSKINYCSPISVTVITTEIPAQFTLYQNYPNPFNPFTKIKFDIPAVSNTGIVKAELNIYDVLGRKTAILVNEHLQPGTYEVQWDAINFPSGVYFYELKAGSFSEIKKMFLIK
ncbi:MAG: M14 family zinc carboxypeptidase [Ignavibacteria bacterium]